MFRIPAQRAQVVLPISPLVRRGVVTPCQSRNFHSTRNRFEAKSQTPTSSSHSSSSKSTTSGSSVGLLALSAAFGVIGYAIGQLRTSKEDVDSPPRYGTAADLEKAIAELKEALDEDSVSTDAEDLRIHGTGLLDFYLSKSPHSAIVYPSSTEDVVKIVKIATKYRIPVMAYSGGTSIEGQLINQTDVCICVDMNKMNKILEIHEEDSDMVCQPAVGWVELNETLKEKGIPLFFPLDPGPGATVGGMLSTGCSGTNAVRYGTAKAEWFLNATVVLPSGKVIKTRQRARKSSAGFDMTKLFIGAEGTLGIVTEVTIRLAPRMPTTVAIVSFPDVQSATHAATEAINQGVGIQCVELMDNTFMAAINRFSMSQRKWAEKDSLFFKFQGHSSESLKQTASVVKKIAEKHGGSSFTLARDEKESEELWDVRKNAAHSALGLLEGCQLWSTDVCVPVSRLPLLIEETKKDLEKVGLVSTILGHVGDGNFHALLLFRDDEELDRARHAVHRIIERAIELDGTCTGEHGVGVGKQKYLVKELGEGTVELMKMIKKTVDPLNLFNPGKLYPEASVDEMKN